MKGTGKYILGIFMMSLFFVLYVRGQVSLLHVSYEIDSKADRVTQLSEEYRQLRFEVDQLKAPRLLDEKMKQMSMELTLPQEIRVVKLPAPAIAQGSLQNISSGSMTARFTDILGRWIGVAQAKTDN